MAALVVNGSSDAASSGAQTAKKQILINAFDMSTIGHLSPGQWKVSELWLVLCVEVEALADPDPFIFGHNIRTPATNRQRKENFSTGLTLPNSLSAAVSMHCSLQILMAATTPTKAV